MRDDRAYIAHLQAELQMLRQLLQFVVSSGTRQGDGRVLLDPRAVVAVTEHLADHDQDATFGTAGA